MNNNVILTDKQAKVHKLSISMYERTNGLGRGSDYNFSDNNDKESIKHAKDIHAVQSRFYVLSKGVEWNAKSW